MAYLEPRRPLLPSIQGIREATERGNLHTPSSFPIAHRYCTEFSSLHWYYRRQDKASRFVLIRAYASLLVRMSDLLLPTATVISNGGPPAGFVLNPDMYIFERDVAGSRHGFVDHLVSYITQLLSFMLILDNRLESMR